VIIGRREFITLSAGALSVPFAAGAQPAKLPTIGMLGGATPAAQALWTAAFVQRLQEVGWTEGQTVGIEYRWAEGRFDRSPEFIAEFVRLKVDVILTHATANVLAAKRATSVIPIVFASAGDPVGNGLVASLGRPGGNVTGLSVQSSDLANKVFDLVRELLPDLRHVAALSRVNNPVTSLQMSAIRAAGKSLGIDVTVAEIRNANDIASAVEALAGRVEVLIVPSDPLFNTNRIQINTLALSSKLPTIYFDRLYVESGGLMSYGPHWASMWQRAADFVDKILRGAKPADLPVEQPRTFELVINVKTAKALGLTISRKLLASTDALVE
jgi:putative ABC transport system substrate-binding protein